MTLLRFLLLCFCWGSTFIPLKEGLVNLPPLLFAGLRFVLAASVFTGVLLLRKKSVMFPKGHDLQRLTLATLLSICLNYGLLFWGAQFLPSGISGLVSFGAVAFALTGLSLGLGLESPKAQKVIGLGLGLTGLILLVAPKLGTDLEQFMGIAAISLGGLVYGIGSLLIRPLLKKYDIVTLTSYQMSVGGVILVLAGFITEAKFSDLQLTSNPKTVLSLVYLVAVGSLLGFWLYYRLLATWEVSRVALYNFVSPIIALGLGVLIYSERFTLLEGLAATSLLLGVLVNYAPRLRLSYDR